MEVKTKRMSEQFIFIDGSHNNKKFRHDRIEMKTHTHTQVNEGAVQVKAERKDGKIKHNSRKRLNKT